MKKMAIGTLILFMLTMVYNMTRTCPTPIAFPNQDIPVFFSDEYYKRPLCEKKDKLYEEEYQNDTLLRNPIDETDKQVVENTHNETLSKEKV